IRLPFAPMGLAPALASSEGRFAFRLRPWALPPPWPLRREDSPSVCARGPCPRLGLFGGKIRLPFAPMGLAPALASSEGRFAFCLRPWALPPPWPLRSEDSPSVCAHGPCPRLGLFGGKIRLPFAPMGLAPALASSKGRFAFRLRPWAL